ncbi:MAG TPA: CBS domain-containing protein [Methylomirabilota bacterium]|nr:CBS domain-containing protein [Methylomirabilota bacterium]
MKAQDSMTHDVITVTPTTPIHEVAALMANHGVSGLPVLDEKGSVVGIVTEADLLVRQKPRARMSWWSLFLDGERMAREFQRAVGTTAGEVMTREVISIGPDLPIEAAAAILHGHGIRRVPVVADGVLVGILSRGDLVKALAGAPPRTAAPVSDARLVETMKAGMAAEVWAPRGIVVEAVAGVLTLRGLVGTQAECAALETMARSIPGVAGVDNQLVVNPVLPSGV